MLQKSSSPSRVARLLACTSILILASGLAGCQTSGLSDITGSLGETAEPARAADPRRAEPVELLEGGGHARTELSPLV